MNKKKIFEKSIVLIGPVGAGKSLISRGLSKSTGMPVFCLDLMAHCPHDVAQMEDRRLHLNRRLLQLEEMLESDDLTATEIAQTSMSIKEVKNEIWVCESQIEMRKRWPDLPNYEDLGFKGKVSDFLRQKFGPEAAFYYRKQFECKFLRAVAATIKEPCIVDVGGGMPVILEDECKKLDEQARMFDEKLYLENFDLSVLNFEHIQESLKPFKNVVELKLPENYKDTMEKASRNSKFNDEYIESGCFEKLATQTVEVGGIVECGIVDEEKLGNKVKEIEKHCKLDVSVR